MTSNVPSDRAAGTENRVGASQMARPLAHHSKTSFSRERWENEGGHVDAVSETSFPAYEKGEKFDMADAEAVRLERELIRDYAAGRVGMLHNTYQHRARLVRQAVARREALRDEASATVSE